MSQELVLYDLPTTGRCACWSLNPWKSRLVLNYKKVPYKTEWVKFPDVEPKLKSLGVEPGQKSFKPYVLPAVKFADGNIAMESMDIAEKLEALYPEPTLQMDKDDHRKVQATIDAATFPVLAFVMPPVRDLFDDETRAWFEEDRKGRLGMSLDEFAAAKGTEESWKALIPEFERIAKELRAMRVDEGPFILGSKVSYSDFIVCGFVEMFKRIEGGKTYKRLIAVDPIYKEINDACGEWLARDDH